MKLFILTTFFLIALTGNGEANDSVLLISRSMMNPKYDQLLLATQEGWLFKQGNDENWSKPGIADSGWRTVRPTQLSKTEADKNGRLEGWFRIRIRLDSSFVNTPVGIRISTWAACDLYIDGKKIGAFGNTGSNGEPYAEHMPYNKAAIPVDLRPGNMYTIAIHFVDYISPFPPRQLKSQGSGGLTYLIRVTGPKYNTSLLRGIKEIASFDMLWIAVPAVLSLLFILLAIQNPKEKNIRLMALTCVSLAFLMFFETASQGMFSLSYTSFFLFTIGSSLAFASLIGSLPITIAGIFQRKIAVPVKIIVPIASLLSFIGNSIDSNLLVLAAVALICVVTAYYVVSSWRKLHGAQWAVVVGLLLSLCWGVSLMILVLRNTGEDLPYFNLFVTGYCLSFPLSLLVYVAIRFKEIINDVQKNAEQVIQLSMEKEQQALNQQRLLEEEVKRQTAEIRMAMDNLKATQSQLIQSEKMASLGELTAGIAHEIQNPLNFVNNFSEVNNELIEEVKTEKSKLNSGELDDLLNDIFQNNEKINFHGKRADAIVKGMLQHSRSGSGQKELTDINVLADEYLRLAYHGLRAKDKTFNAKFETELDPGIGKIEIVPQDIGRVLLNLINNAFYAVTERQKKEEPAYEPTATLRTKKVNGKIEVHIEDNGRGIPDNIRDKIFQPFFTTKPTGQGTGLGLSLSYDIIKAHGGEIKVMSSFEKGSTFIIQLPAGNV